MQAIRKKESTSGDRRRLCQEIYSLVRREHDDDAEEVLKGLGEDLVPVANELIAGDYRVTTLKLTFGSVGCAAMAIAPIVITTIMCPRLGIPPYLDSGLGQILLRFGLAGIMYVAEVTVTGAVLDSMDAKKRDKELKHPIFRLVEMACIALAGAPDESLEQIGGLLLALRTDPEASAITRNIVKVRLTQLLAEADPDLLRALGSDHRDAMLADLNRITNRVKLEDTPSPDEPPFDLDHPCDIDAGLGAAMLQVYESVPDGRALKYVREIVQVPAEAVRLDWGEMIAAAHHCLPILEENVRRSEGSEVLLRSSDGGGPNGDALLRPSVAMAESDGAQLLRPSGSE